MKLLTVVEASLFRSTVNANPPGLSSTNSGLVSKGRRDGGWSDRAGYSEDFVGLVVGALISKLDAAREIYRSGISITNVRTRKLIGDVSARQAVELDLKP